jgi:hypothetical protein
MLMDDLANPVFQLPRKFCRSNRKIKINSKSFYKMNGTRKKRIAVLVLGIAILVFMVIKILRDGLPDVRFLDNV